MLEVEYSKPWTTKSVKQRHEMKLERKTLPVPYVHQILMFLENQFKNRLKNLKHSLYSCCTGAVSHTQITGS